MRAMRNVMIHEYFFVDLRIVWSTFKSDLPQLKQWIEGLMSDARQERDGQEHQSQ